MLTLLLILIFYTVSSNLLGCHGKTIVNVASGVYSTKVELDGLTLSSTSTFRLIDTLTIQLHLTNTYSVFVNYQITVPGSRVDFWTKLQISHNGDDLTNAGSLVHYGTQFTYKTATGYWMDNLKPDYYTFEVYYKSSSSISVPADLDYQTAILQVMWFTNAPTASDGIKCYPTPYTLNRYHVFSPLKGLKATLPPYNERVVLAAYQLAVYSSSKKWFIVKMHQHNQQLNSTNMIRGDGYYFTLNSLWIKSLLPAEYEFGLTYRNDYKTYFEDCRNDYRGNKNLYAMYLPYSCSIITTIRPNTNLRIFTTSWMNTDLSYSFTLYQTEHIIVRYQYTSRFSSYHTSRLTTRLSIDTVRQHTAAISGNYYIGNSGMWQGALSSGRHNITLQIKSSFTYTQYFNDVYTRAMDIVRCI